MWWLGVFLIILCQPIYIFAAILVKISVTGVIDPFKLLINISLARIYLDEKIGFLEAIGITMFILGAVMTLLFSKPENHLYGREEINMILYSDTVILYLGLSFLAMVICFTLWHYILLTKSTNLDNNYGQQIDDDELSGTRVISSSSNLGRGISSPQKLNTIKSHENNYSLNTPNRPLSFTNLTLFKNPRFRYIPLIVYPYFGPFIGCLSMILVRVSYGLLISESSQGFISNLKNIDIWVYATLIIIFRVGLYMIMNKNLKHYETIYVLPLFKIGNLLHSLIGGALFLNEFGEYTPEQLLFFLWGIFLWISGIIVLIIGNDRKEKEKIRKENEAFDFRLNLEFKDTPQKLLKSTSKF